MSIGNHEDAALALATDNDYRELSDHWAETDFQKAVDYGTWLGATESWVLQIDEVAMLGSGSTRRVWTIDGKVAYKVCYGGYTDNEEEWERWEAYHDKMPEGTRLPEMSAFVIDDGPLVIAVEIIPFPRQHARIPHLPFEWFDNGEYNYRVAPDGTFIPIDFAC